MVVTVCLVRLGWVGWGRWDEEGREEKCTGGWQRPTLPHRYQCSTIGARELNCRVRDGAGWTLTALATNNACPCLLSPLPTPPYRLGFRLLSPQRICLVQAAFSPDPQPKSARPLVPVSCTCCHASTSGLSNWWSASGLTPSRVRVSHLEVGFPLRCFQRFSAPQLATQRCRWHDNWHTSAASTPVLSY